MDVILENLLKYSDTGVMLGLFFSILIFYVLNVGYCVKKILKISQWKKIKLFDCFQCVTFWTTLLTTFSIMNAMTAFVIAFFYSNLTNNK